jgi:hypothetical protein
MTVSESGGPRSTVSEEWPIETRAQTVPAREGGVRG